MEPIPDYVSHAVECTTPIFIVHDAERPEQVGTGVVIRLSNRVFVSSAAHVFDQFRPWDRPHIALGSDLVPLLGTVTKSSSHPFGRPGDPYDIALAEIDLSTLGLGSFPGLSPEALDLSESDYTDSILTLIGCPWAIQDSSVVDGHMETRMLHLSVTSSTTEIDARTGRSTHVILDYDEADVYTDGERSPATELDGTSGAGVWTVGPAGRLTMVGVFTDHRPKSRRLVAARPWLVAMALRRLAPELAYLLPVR